ncbi:ATP-grasp domain-containing protein, partial [Escherichia coli]|uniref:ATP-grasp domain-containing protein n=1 Tax=Escherichia coli TaxID=562 RepID=UPI0027D27CCB
MKIHEFQAKRLLAPYGLAAPAGAVAITPREAGDIARRRGRQRVMVKAQIHAGGRQRAGGIHQADDAEAAEIAASRLLRQ